MVRGGTAAISKDDRQPHLNEEGAFTLLRSALARYKEVHRTLPARIVIHKSSSYSEEERLGFEQALAEVEIESYDLLHLRESEGRLYRAGVYPPLRGTMLELSEDESLLYPGEAFHSLKPIQACMYQSPPILLSKPQSKPSVS